MKHKQFDLRAGLITAALLALPIGQAFAMDHGEYAAGKSRIGETYKADKAGCKSLSGNGKDVCMEQAKAKEKVAKAELRALLAAEH